MSSGRAVLHRHPARAPRTIPGRSRGKTGVASGFSMVVPRTGYLPNWFSSHARAGISKSGAQSIDGRGRQPELCWAERSPVVNDELKTRHAGSANG